MTARGGRPSTLVKRCGGRSTPTGYPRVVDDLELETDCENVLEMGYTTTDEGTGYGLAIVREVANAHGWDLRVTDGTEGGARFEVTEIDRVRASDTDHR